MALKALLLRKQIDNRSKALDAKRAKSAEFETREAELMQAINEVETDEQRDGVQAAIDEFETEKAQHESELHELEREIEGLEHDLAAEEAAQSTEPAPEPVKIERKDEPIMVNRTALNDIVTRDDVKAYLTEVRTAMAEKRAITNVGLTIPEVMLGLIREEVAKNSRLLPFVRRVNVSGIARQNIMGAIPEAVWTEMCANLNELSLGFNQIEVDGYKVGGFVIVCNAILEDSDLNLASEIVTAIGGAIGKALDKAILFGTGTKMPTGIATRLAQTSQPANWGTYAPAWVDLHTSNVQTLNIKSSSGESFFMALIEKLAIAKDVYKAGGLFWVMNRKTHLDILAKALHFNANAALVSNTTLFPIIGGTIVEFEDDELSDYEIIGGFGGNYLLAERQGIEFASSTEVRFLQDQTAFKGTARYDGTPVDGKAFVIVNYNNTSPTTSKDFPIDWANTDLNELTVSAAAGSASGDTVLTVTGYLADSTPVLYYKAGTQKVAAGDSIVVSGTGAWSALTSGTTQITAAAGKVITVVELNDAAADGGVVVSAGTVRAVPKS